MARLLPRALVLLVVVSGLAAADWVDVSDAPSPNGSTWAVIVSTSRYWLNYRHTANALAMYQAVKRSGVPDSRIVLMLAEDFSTNPRNVFPGEVFLDPSLEVEVTDGGVEVDYAGDEVSAETLVRVLTGRHSASLPKSKTLGTDEASDVLVYVTGHGGENFMKFQDKDQMSGEDIADALREMGALGRYREVSLVVDTCKASTFCQHISSPNTTCLASSLRGQNSYSKHSSGEVGNSLVDEMTYLLHRMLTRRGRGAASSWDGKLVGRDAARAMYKALHKAQKLSTPYVAEL
ncbi:GPI-anchor transamidase [Chloropicon primus]|uniref:GPI-anchor transamidase n=1 Tax=Chloropicon primus TaxID=1764295 RepID=A0A5B8MGY6_9CHLO|nr:GPI-anchor transamidase [Chloropicon primus]UPQ98879.1 GPI-anchor transamidase [Chloropicon primus]|mmetsp:Transcript_8495/g.24281  ORF Transcript_8495/g.24281 Transcript_8495/m.24281 type:complete len:291 (+) Transcript_8495:286-1158(+)|eukprot:QDZ19667.1 GPI-anchor transamidase [Chloropicon primus]